MKPIQAETPTFSDAACKAATSRSIDQWFAELDALGGAALGRRELVHRIHTAANKNDWWATTIVVEYEKARGVFEKDGRPKGYSVCSTKTIAAPVERVFAAFGDPADLDRWLGEGTTIAFADGGELTNADGNRATFTRIRANKDLRLDWRSPDLAPGTSVEVLFADKGNGKTGITLNHNRIQDRLDADVLRATWARAFDRLKAVLESA
jgi:uncharacterized protein YndB with AHSA1/START domain